MPPRPRRYAYEDRELFEEATALRVRVDGLSLRAWRFGRGPQVLVQHGWGGRTAQMSAIIRAIVDRGYSVLAVDAPGHGASGWRSRSSIPAFAQAIEALLQRHGPVFATVAHSLGAPAVARVSARRGIGRLILIAPLSKPRSFYRRLMRWVGLDATSLGLRQSLDEARVGLPFARLDLRENLGARADALIIHDRGDRRVPHEGSAELASALPGVSLRTTEGLGHNRILSDAAVVSHVLGAIESSPGPRVGADAATSQIRLTPQELWADLQYGRA
jgi:pimeloyl-ACP methyl ester carboxylesterase